MSDKKNLSGHHYERRSMGEVHRDRGMTDIRPSNQHLSWADMFAQICQRHTGKRIADVIGVSEQYVSDLRRGMRRPTVEITDKICDWMGRGPKGRLEWHQAGARAHGWRV